MTLRWWTCVLTLALGGCSESHEPGTGDGDADSDADSDSDSDSDSDADGDADQPNACGDACADAACCSYRQEGGLPQFYCTDVTFDQANCGECGHACGVEQLCQESECVCWAGSPCGDRCFDLTSDPLNCGGCGTACPGDLPACRGGVCLSCADAGLLDCDGVCVRAEIDDHNCGDCGVTCEAGTECVGSTCVGGECEDVDCLAGSACCDHVYGGVRGCADLRTDPFNCGGCSERCLQGDTCVDGGCGCSPWQANCDGVCVDLNYDPSNCGECGNRCDRDHPLCNNGECADCELWGATACGGACVGLDWDPRNCGECGEECAADEYCNMGNCQRAQ